VELDLAGVVGREDAVREHGMEMNGCSRNARTSSTPICSGGRR
jgi:hypothetical protein